MRTLIACILIVVSGGIASAGDCVNNSCNLRSRSVTVVRELINVPVQVTRRTVEATRNVGRRTVARVRSVVR
jgi:hypothetical protein